MLVCITCWTVFDRYSLMPLPGDRPCPIRNCEGPVVEIDENLLYAIRLLNDKFYFTTHCCSGHLTGADHDYVLAYIAFDSEIKEKELLPTPAGWTLETAKGHGPILRADFTRADAMKSQKAMFAGIIALTQWAAKLAPRDLGL